MTEPMVSDRATSVDVVEMTVDEVQAAFAGGATDSASSTGAFLERIATWDPHYTAIIVINPETLDSARASGRRRAAGQTLGPLDGVPVVVKDPMDMVGFPTTAGWRLLHAASGGINLMPATDSPAVARTKAAGAVILGKTSVPVLSHTGSHANDSWAGPTYNAAGREILPGGGSAGTATAVAASMAVLGLAEETGGSIQNPASAQGLVGIKPTSALAPNAGVMPLSSNRDVVGPIARCVRDAATATEDAFGPSGVLGFMPNLPQFGPCLADPSRPPDVSEFTAPKESHLAIFGEVWARQRLDGPVFPQMREQLPPLHGSGTIQETTVGEINIAGLPGVTVPDASGAPFNLIFVGPMWSEADLLGLAFAHESATHHRRAPALQVG